MRARARLSDRPPQQVATVGNKTRLRHAGVASIRAFYHACRRTTYVNMASTYGDVHRVSTTSSLWRVTTPRSTLGRRMRHADRASQLLRVAEATFAEVGFHAATMDDIAARAGVSRTVLYRHYDSKDALAAASLARSRAYLKRLLDLESLLGAGSSFSVEADAKAAVIVGARAAFTFIRANARLYSVFLAEGTLTSSPAQAEAEGVRTDVEELAVRLLRQAKPEAEEARLRICARAMVGASERLAQGLALESATELEIDETVSVLVELAWAGLATL